MRSKRHNNSGCPIHRAFAPRDGWVFATRTALFLLAVAIGAQAQFPREPVTVRIGVLSLFHPKTLTLTADHTITLLLDGTPHTFDPHHTSLLQASEQGIAVDSVPAHSLSLPADVFTLGVPNKLARSYRGALTVTSRRGVLVPVITIDTELAVASIVAAESPPGAPLEAFKAQAIATRSYLLGNPHAHRDFDACDTTHCQFLRSPPAASSPAASATRATRNIVLTWRPSLESTPNIVAAMYSRSCGGQTRTLAAPDPTRYPFYPVLCDFCRRHPEVRANTHGVGLCQLGAADLARRGKTYSQILALYYPNTTLMTLP